MRSRKIQVFLAGIVLLALVFPPVAVSAPKVVLSPFADISPDHPQAREFSLLKVLEIFEGYPDGQVRPSGPVTRLQFAKVAVCLASAREEVRAASQDHPEFTDGGQISPVWWGWVNASRSLGLVHGYEDGSFRPRSNITFVEAVAVLLRVAGYESFAAELDYPYGYIRKAHQVGLTSGVELAPQMPITRGEIAVLAVNALALNPPDERGVPAADHAAEYRSSRLEEWPGRVDGVVSSVSGEAIIVDDEEHSLAPEVFLFGVDSFADLQGKWIAGFTGDEQGIAYIETVEGPVQLTGRLREIDRDGGGIRVDDRWLQWMPGEDDSTTWRLNGARVSTSTALDRLSSALDRDDDIEVQLAARGDWIEDIDAHFWDTEMYVLTEPEQQVDGQWRVPVGVVSEGRIERRKIHFPPETLPEIESPKNMQTAGDFKPGHAIFAATRGGSGIDEGEVVDSALFLRMSISERVRSGEVANVEAVHDNGELHFSFELEDGTTVWLSREHLIDIPGDVTLNELYRAEYLSLIEGHDGSVVSVLDARIAGPRSKYVRILAVWKIEVGAQVRSAYIVVDEAGEAVTYEFSHPSRWSLFVDDDLEMKQDRLVRLAVDDAGKCEGVVSWVAEDPLPGEYVVSYVQEEEGLVTVRQVRDANSDAIPLDDPTDRERHREVLMAMDAVAYTPGGEYVAPESLRVGERVRVYLDEEDGAVALLETLVD